MAKKKTLEINEIGILTQPPEIQIQAAQIKDAFCNYSYELIAGTGEGDLINRKGSAIVHDDMRIAFKKLNVHLAVICEEIEPLAISEIEEYENIEPVIVYEPGSLMEKVSKYRVSGFKTGDEGEGYVILEGVKILSTDEHVSLKTPRVKWEGNYSFLNELRVCIDDIITEVEAYMNGKAAPKYKQTKMEFETPNPLNGEFENE